MQACRPLDPGRGGGRGVRCQRVCPRPGRKERSQAAQEAARRVAGACRPGATRAASRHAHRGQAAALHAGACQARLFQRSGRASAMRSRSSRRCWARSTIAMFGSRILPSLPTRNRAKSNSTLAVRSVSSVCGPDWTICGRSGRTAAARSSRELAAFWQELKDRGVWDRLATIVEWGDNRAKSPDSNVAHDSSPAEVVPRA